MCVHGVAYGSEGMRGWSAVADVSGSVLSRAALSKGIAARSITQTGVAGVAGTTGATGMAGAAGMAGAIRAEVGREAVAETRHPPGRPIRGVRAVTATLTALVRSARREFLIFDDPGSCLGQGIPEQFLEFADACVRAAGDPSAGPVGRGASGKPGGREGPGGLGGPPGLGPPGGRGQARASSVEVRRIVPRQGLAALPFPVAWPLPGRARQTDSIPFKMILVDRAVAAVPLDLQLHYNGLLLIRDPVIVQVLVRTHQLWWDSGEELPPAVLPLSAASQGSGALPEPLRPVLEALLAGLTDEAAATRLGMSSRTYSRRVCDLLTALGTTSRFRAGAEAARRGWI